MTTTLPASSTTAPPSASGISADPLVLQEGDAGSVVMAHIAGQVGIILRQEGRVRAHDAEAVHDMRVATRRLRSVLATFRPLFRAAATDPIRPDLNWLGAFLGGVRDAEVQRNQLLDAVAAEPSDLVMGLVGEHVDAEMQRARRVAETELTEVLDSPRYRAMLTTLQALGAHPRLTALAAQPVHPTLTRLVRRSWKRIQVLTVAAQCPDPGDRDRQLHEIRKAARSLRYACEAVEPAFGKPAAALASVAAFWQTILGEHQDSVVARDILRGMGIRMFLEGENPFTIGRLHALEQARGDRAELDFAQAWHIDALPAIGEWLQK